MHTPKTLNQDTFDVVTGGNFNCDRTYGKKKKKEKRKTDSSILIFFSCEKYFLKKWYQSRNYFIKNNT